MESNMEDVVTKTKVSTDVQPPQMYKVIYLNDHTTTFDFVIESLMSIFGHSVDESLRLAHQVNDEGSAIVAVLSYEIAETKSVEVTKLARQNGFPLQIRVAPENE
jgi:ATP-dependent Clp protease adaptor protein ClpS